MTNPQVLSGELKASRHRKTVVTHVLRSWEARNVKKGGDLMGVYLVLLDEKDTYAEKAHERPLPEFLDELMGRTFSSPIHMFQASLPVKLGRNIGIWEFSHITNTNKSSLNLITKVRKQYSQPLSPTQRPAAFIRLKLEPDGASQTSNTRTTRQKSSFMKTCLIHNKPGAQYIVGMDEYFLYKNIDKAQSRT
ncbi:hypothetical protein YC2023_060310 [Brassica napus]